MKSVVVEVALSSDRRFYPGLLVTACSIAENVSRDVDVVFHVLDGGIGDDFRQDLTGKLHGINSRSRVNWLSVDQSAFKELPEWRGHGKMAWARLLLPRLLPNSDWVIYYDVDFLCLGDLAKLWALRDDGVSIMSSPDMWPLSVEAERKWSEGRGFEFDSERYFCTGCCVFNLNRLRREGYAEKLLDVALHNDGFITCDQTVLNAVFCASAELKLLPRKWQAYTRDMTSDDIVSRHNLHYAGEAPWVCIIRNKILNDASLFWFRYYAKLHGISTWDAMKRFYTVPTLIRTRLTYLILSRIPGMKQILFAYFRIVKHPESVVIFNAFLHRFKLHQ